MTDTHEGKESVAAIVARVRQGKQAKRTAKPNAKGNGASAAAGNGRLAKSAGATAAKPSGGRTSLRGPAPGGVRKVTTAAAAKRNVSFSKGPDTVLKVREVPLGQQMKYIVDIAKARRRPVLYSDFKSEKNIAIQGPILDQARKHQYLIVDQESQTIQYKPKYTLASKQELHQKIRQNALGLMTNDLYDAYELCEAHIKELLQDGEVFLIDSTERSGSVVYPNILKAVGDMPNDEVRGALLDVELPQQEAQIDEALKEAKIRKAKRSTPRLKMAVIQDNRQPVKKKRESKIRKLTNAHLAELFQGNGHASIDG